MPTTPVSLKDPGTPGSLEPNPFGFIHYMEEPRAVPEEEEEVASYDEKMASCSSLPRPEPSSSPREAPWGRRLPPLHGHCAPLRVTSELALAPSSRDRDRPVPHATSAPALATRRQARPSREESPPDWISCFPKSPKAGAGRRKVPEDAYRKATVMKYIDKTPSADSLNLPYCPPVKVEYEDFSNSALFHQPAPGFASPQLPRQAAQKRLSAKIRSRSLGRDHLAVIPVPDPALLPHDTSRPQLVRSEVVARVTGYPRRGEEATPRPACSCDSRRSSDSGLADVASHSYQCLLHPSLQSVASLPAARSAPRLCACGATLPPAPLSQSLDPLPAPAPAATSYGDLASDPAAARWSKTKETYKTGLYAHWWLNASLQPISEEPHLSTQL
jgi:hypothetical protein